MNRSLNKLISDTVEQAFANAPEKLINREVQEIQKDICPHCKKKIQEKNDYTTNGGVTWRHRDCGGLLARPETSAEQINNYIRTFIKEFSEITKEAKALLGHAPLPSEEPGGTMAAVNTSGLAKESERDSEIPYKFEDEESGNIGAIDNDPKAPDYDSSKPPVILHPYPKSVPQFGVNEIKIAKHVKSNIKIDNG